MNPVFSKIQDGHVYRSPEAPDEVAINPRTAVLASGEVACSFMLQSGFGINDFKPLIAFSKDEGRTWSEPRLIWPHLIDRFSCIGQISAIPKTNSLLFFGARFPIDQPGEQYWRDDIKGLKQNELVWARSDDGGQTWSDPHGIPMPYPGAAEVQGPILATLSGAWLACYAPYRTWDESLAVELNCLIQLRSEDQGKSWEFSRIMTFPEQKSGAAEAWIAESEKDALIATCWHTNLADHGTDFTNKYAFSRDGGKSWSGPHDTGIQGQSTSLLTLAPRQVMMVYNQRKQGEPGIRGAFFQWDDAKPQITGDEMLWGATQGTRSNSSGDHANWTDFSFGEPAVVRTSEKRYLLVFWEKSGPGRHGISTRLLEKNADHQQ